MKILTLNTWGLQGPWQQRWPIIFNEIKTRRPEIVAFQEIPDQTWIREVTEKTHFSYVLMPETRCGLALLTHFPVKRWQNFIFQTRSPREEWERSVLCVELETQNGKLGVMNTHLSWRLEDSLVREGQVKEMLDIAESQFHQMPVIAMGDFNAPPHSDEIRKMIEAGKFSDTYADLHPGKNGFTWDNQNPFTAAHGLPDRRLDYMFIRDKERRLGKLEKVEMVLTQPDEKKVYASDHFGLFAALKPLR